jgi:mRNA interferase HigB
MLIVGREEFDAFMMAHADSRSALTTWLARATVARWHGPLDVLRWYARASVIRKGLLVFDIKGNDYRLAARIDFANGIVRVLRVGTHAEYDTWSL